MNEKAIHHIAKSLAESDIYWDAFLHELVVETDSTGAVLLLIDHKDAAQTRSDHVINLNINDQNRYESYFNRIDPVNSYLAENNGDIIFLQDLPSTKKNMEVEEAFMMPCGFQNRFAMSLPCNDRYSFNVYVNRHTQYSDAEKHSNSKLLQSLKLDIKTALDKEKHRALARSLTITSHCHGSIFSRLILDEQLYISYLDFMTQKILGRNNARLIVGTSLNLLDLPELLVRQIHWVKTSKQQTTFLLYLPDGDFDVSIVPTEILIGLSDWQLPNKGFVILFYQANEKLVIIKRLMGLYGLTKTEAEVALLFTRFSSLKNMATELNRSVETVRTHIKRVMTKLCVRSQSELLRVLLAFTKHG